MTDVQKEMCMDHPDIIQIMFEDAGNVFKHHCHTSFRHDKWTCRGIDPPMFKTVQTFLELGELYLIANNYCVHKV